MNSNPKNPKSNKNLSKFSARQKIVASAAILAAVAAGIKNGKQIYEEIFGENVDIRVGWVTLKDPSSFECIIGHGSRFKMSKDESIAMVDNSCLSDLRRRIESVKNKSAQTVMSSYFIIIDNVGPDVDEIEIHSESDNDPPLLKARDLRKGDSVVMCVGYEGRSGAPSRNDSPGKLVVERKGRLSVNVSIPHRDTYSRINKSDCPGVGFGYPIMPDAPADAASASSVK